VAGDYEPVLELTRGRVIESVHFGAAVIVDSGGRLLAWLGNPQTVTYMRSSAKPLQALSFIESGGDQTYHLTSKELALICSSHEGTDEHVEVVKGIQDKVGIQESDLLCGAHPPFHALTQQAMLKRGEEPTQNRNNCSGKHTGMLAYARMRGLPISDYINPEHPIQKIILETIAEMCNLPVEKIEIGIDGCSAPNFALPLYNAALGFSRLCDPHGLHAERASACRRIVAAMMANPVMVSGVGRFDTRLMEVCEGRIVAKGGAEGFYSMGIMAGVLGAGLPGIGIAIKIADGDLSIRKSNGESYNRTRPAVALEILRQMEYIDQKELEALAIDFGPTKPVVNARRLVTGVARSVFTLQRPESIQ
jgi:L-asparaginase II